MNIKDGVKVDDNKQYMDNVKGIDRYIISMDTNICSIKKFKK